MPTGWIAKSGFKIVVRTKLDEFFLFTAVLSLEDFLDSGGQVVIGVTSPNGNLCTLRVPQGSQVSLDDVLAETPNVVTREIDVLPAQRG